MVAIKKIGGLNFFLAKSMHVEVCDDYEFLKFSKPHSCLVIFRSSDTPHLHPPTGVFSRAEYQHGGVSYLWQ